MKLRFIRAFRRALPSLMTAPPHRLTPKLTSVPIVLATVFVLGLVPCVVADDNHECSTATLKGSFGFTGSGTVVGVGPIALVGRQTFDGQGHTSALFTVSRNGVIIPNISLAGTYTVNTDCTGSLTLGPIDSDFVIVANGMEFRAINKAPGDIVTVVGRKQFKGD